MATTRSTDNIGRANEHENPFLRIAGASLVVALLADK